MTTTLYYCSMGLPIELDHDTKEIIYKENRVLVSALIDAFDSGFDKVKLSPKLSYKRRMGVVEFGCLTMAEDKFKLLKRKVCQLLKDHQ